MENEIKIKALKETKYNNTFSASVYMNGKKVGNVRGGKDSLKFDFDAEILNCENVENVIHSLIFQFKQEKQFKKINREFVGRGYRKIDQNGG